MGFGFSFGVCAVDMGLRLGVYLVLIDCVGWVGVLFCLFFYCIRWLCLLVCWICCFLISF